ncbi:MAG TPA: tRNA (adenosine(37)-N6)-dimethylallyltransferase MiaA [Bacillota bacterium]|nr:tRNA (adenosine(37)-N6)-dimethylallyltransferase MiaA [Bacillota bacterium]
MRKPINVVFLAGPTAGGKTEYAVRLAAELGGEIVSADSMQIYKYMDIGSAKPSPEERTAARHWLVDEIEPSEPFSVADYQKRAKACVADIAERGRLPIVCGGTGLYLNALIYDMDFSASSGDPGKRAAIWASVGEDPKRLHELLTSLDPAAALEIHENNVKRMLRAVERLQGGEEKLAAFKTIEKRNPDYNAILIGLERDRAELYERIDRRVDKLYEAGLAQEVKALSEMGFTASDIAMKGIGYKEIMDAVAAGGSAADAAETIKLNTRHYAKRQMTWLRRYEDMKWFTLKGDAFCEDAFNEMKSYIRGRLI